MIAIIDYGAGNLQSVEKAFRFIGAEIEITKDAERLREAEGVVLPGVGAFGDSMASLKSSGLVHTIYDIVEEKKPFLGICLGLQMLFAESEESPGVPGLGILKGKIRRIPDTYGLKVPHIGWNSLELRRKDGLFAGLSGSPYVYFVHSYYLKAEEDEAVSSRAQYGVTIDASVQKDRLFATQFHPEKSGRAGLKMLQNFVALTQKGTEQ